MLKFVHKKHINQEAKSKFRFVIYYSASDIVLGILLMALTTFFIYNYLQSNIYPSHNDYSEVQVQQSRNATPTPPTTSAKQIKK